MFNFWSGKKKRVTKRVPVTKERQHYLAHKEMARELVLTRLHYWNQFYNFNYNRVVIRNQKTCWGSCSSLKNLNFSYKIIFLPIHLQDYVVLHELCHLKELHHGPAFWQEMAKVMPDFSERRGELRKIERQYHTFVLDRVLY